MAKILYYSNWCSSAQANTHTHIYIMAQKEQPKGRANDMVNLSKKKEKKKSSVEKEFKTHKQHDTSRQSVKRQA